MASPDPKHVLSLAANMVKARENLASLQAEWDSLFTISTPEIKRPGKRPTDAEALTTRIVEFLDAEPQYHYSVSDLVTHFGVEKVQMERALNRLYATKKIARHSRGQYESAKPEDDPQ